MALKASTSQIIHGIFTDRTFNDVYADDGISYEVRKPQPKDFPCNETKLTAPEGTVVSSLKIFRLKSIWPH